MWSRSRVVGVDYDRGRKAIGFELSDSVGRGTPARGRVHERIRGQDRNSRGWDTRSAQRLSSRRSARGAVYLFILELSLVARSEGGDMDFDPAVEGAADVVVLVILHAIGEITNRDHVMEVFPVMVAVHYSGRDVGSD
jgi:hypothetical protein